VIRRRLEGPELVGYDHIEAALLSRVRITKVPFLTPGTGGMTLGHHVLLVNDSDRSGRSMLLAHELVHVRQFSEVGRVGFLVRYLRDYFGGLIRLRSHRAAYLDIPAEVEAREAAAAWAVDCG